MADSNLCNIETILSITAPISILGPNIKNKIHELVFEKYYHKELYGKSIVKIDFRDQYLPLAVNKFNEITILVPAIVNYKMYHLGMVVEGVISINAEEGKVRVILNDMISDIINDIVVAFFDGSLCFTYNDKKYKNGDKITVEITELISTSGSISFLSKSIINDRSNS